MKFAHLADTHLGYRQYGLLEREQDFYDVFDKCIDKIIEEKCDFVIHSGDLFEFSKPSPRALLHFQKAFLRLREADIPVYAIAGNHDSVRRKGAIPPQLLFKDLGLRLLSPNNPIDNYQGVLICGMPYVPKSNKSLLLERYELFKKEADKHVLSILLAHQGIDQFLPFGPELEIGDLPDNFDYYAMGHVHNYINTAYGKGRLVYPGSSEIWKASEVGDYEKKGKGFVIVELNENGLDIKRVEIDLPRKFIREIIDYDDLDKKLAFIKESIKDLDEKPIISIIVQNGDFSSSDVNEKIMNELADYALRVRPTFIQNKNNDEDLIGDTSLGARQSLYDTLQSKYGNKDITKFGLDLLDTLSKNDMVNAEMISNDFYRSNYASKNYIEFKRQSSLNKGSEMNLIIEDNDNIADNNDFDEEIITDSGEEVVSDNDDIVTNKDDTQMSLFDSVGGD